MRLLSAGETIPHNKKRSPAYARVPTGCSWCSSPLPFTLGGEDRGEGFDLVARGRLNEPSPLPSPWRRRTWVAPSPNLLYKCLATQAASPRAKTGYRLCFSLGCSLLRTRSGTGKKAGGPPAQTGHDAAQRSAKQKVYCRRVGLDKQTCNCWNILHPQETESEKLFSDRTILGARIQFSDFQQRAERIQHFVAARDGKFSGCLRNSDCKRHTRRSGI